MRPLLDLPLAHLSLDTDTLGRKDETLIHKLLDDPLARAVVLDEPGRPALDGNALAYVETSRVNDRGMTLAYLGRRPDGAGILLASGPALDGLTYADVRFGMARMSDFDRGVVVPATALAHWHRQYQFCPRCGNQTDPVQAGWVRACRACEVEHFPRIDPAVIMAVVDDADRLLLARAAHFGPNRYSTIAGYVEPGESLENAVARETWEEVGLNVTDVVYRGSQPWPFPRSLMFAYSARVEGTPEPVVDGEEIVDARFFTREELARLVDSGELRPPGRASVARSLVDDWFGADLNERDEWL